MSFHSPYVVSDRGDDSGDENPDQGLEILSYDSETSEPEVVVVQNTRPLYELNQTRHGYSERRAASIQLPKIEIPSFTFGNGNVIKTGGTLELKDNSAQLTGTMHSGDFCHVRRIIQNLATGELRFQGHRMRRTKYLGQIFDWKLNELCMILPITEGDSICPSVAGMEEFAPEDVIGVRECELTNKPYPLKSFRDSNCSAYPSWLSQDEIRLHIFQQGRLCCRFVMILSKRETNQDTRTVQKLRSGIVRQLYASETVTHGISTPSPTNSLSDAGISRKHSIIVHDDEEDCDVIVVSRGKKRVRSMSLEILDIAPPKCPLPQSKKRARYTMSDVFCGAGGASQGAAQAGLQVIWGLDKDKLALLAYLKNHLGASGYLCDAHNFPPRGKTIAELRTDIMHFSPPCCYFAPCHTRDGPNDQANMEALYTVGAILKKMRPRIATLEQTFGLVSFDAHIKYFYILLNSIGKAGYDIRYKIQDLSKYGLVQQRKRLLIIAARRGTPLPPFPKETHGPNGSGLKPFVYINQVIKPLERMGRRAWNDIYHQPKPAQSPREPINPETFLKGCITTGGSESYHYSGTRRWTVRELSLFQSFPYGYKFTGSNTEATKQIGNAFPPVVAQAMYCTIVKTLEAFDRGLIDAEEPIFDIDQMIRERSGGPSPVSSTPVRRRGAGEAATVIVLDD